MLHNISKLNSFQQQEFILTITDLQIDSGSIDSRLD